MRRIPALRAAGATACACGLAFSAALVGVALPAVAATADVAPSLEAPMQPITKAGAPAPACHGCVDTDPRDGNGQRLAERSAPEYSALRRPMPMPMSPEPQELLAPQLEPVVPDAVDSGSLLSLPSASITVPGVLP